jgi:Ca-activated chloride channel homolog
LQLRKVIVLCALLFAGCPHGGLSSAETISPGINDQPAISVHSDLVLLPVSVSDPQGKFVSGLAKEDFHIYAEKRLQDVALFEEEDAPVSVGLIVDHSASMRPQMESVTTAVSAFAHSGNPEDEMFVVDFNDNAVVEPMSGKSFTSNSQDLGNAVAAVSASGRTALYDAVAQGLAHLQLARWKKRALVIISDGGDNASRYKYSQILELARQSQVALYSIGLLNESGKEENPRVLRQLCSNTGGVAYFPGSQQAVITFSAQIAQDLREQYLLGFVPEKDLSGDSYHKIAVNVEDPHRGKMLVRTRSGYSVAPTSNGAANLSR